MGYLDSQNVLKVNMTALGEPLIAIGLSFFQKVYGSISLCVWSRNWDGFVQVVFFNVNDQLFNVQVNLKV